MTDRELLELAAIACGELKGDWIGNENYFDGVLGRWNPLADDGDALRLAVGLCMNVDINRVDGITVVLYGYCCPESVLEEHCLDPYAATRRAIVRAAAEIGKATP